MWYSFNDALVKNEKEKSDGKQLYDTSGSQRLDYRDSHTNETLAPPQITKALTEAARFTEMWTQSGFVVATYENGLNFSQYFLMEGVQM